MAIGAHSNRSVEALTGKAIVAVEERTGNVLNATKAVSPRKISIDVLHEMQGATFAEKPDTTSGRTEENVLQTEEEWD